MDEHINAIEYAQGCANILGEPVSLDDVYMDIDELNYRVLEMMTFLELGITTQTKH